MNQLKQYKIAVISKSFSKNPILKENLSTIYPNSVFNHNEDKFSEENVCNFIDDAEGVIVGSETIGESFFNSSKKLRIISKYGVGLDNINIKKCKEHNIVIKHTPGTNALSVAELTLGFMLTMCHNAYPASLELKKNKWNKSGGSLLSGKTIGIIGIGNVGKNLIALLKSFSCKILVNDILNQDHYYQENNLTKATKEDIFKFSDIISFHIPLTKKTYHLISEHSLQKMKKKPLIINTSRGEVIHEGDLKEALHQQTISGAALDVFAQEPPDDQELLKHPHVFCTPHIGGNSNEAVINMGQAAITQLNEFFSQEKNQTL